MPVCRWQEERRKRYPTDANVAKRASEASARRQRGELDPEAEARQLRLHEVIARQQELGLLKVGATEFVCVMPTFPPNAEHSCTRPGDKGRCMGSCI